MKARAFIIPVIIILIILLIWWVATKRRVKGGTTLGYRFFRQKDSPGSDIAYFPEYEGNVKALKNACQEIPECVAFNTAGYVKGSVDVNNLKEYSGFPDWSGLYVKKQILR